MSRSGRTETTDARDASGGGFFAPMASTARCELLEVLELPDVDIAGCADMF
jgi:hypothetical protein